MDFSVLGLEDLRTPLVLLLAHMQLLTVKRLSDTGRMRLLALDDQIRLLMRLIDRCRTLPARAVPIAALDLRDTIRDVILELDAVLSDEASRPL